MIWCQGKINDLNIILLYEMIFLKKTTSDQISSLDVHVLRRHGGHTGLSYTSQPRRFHDVYGGKMKEGRERAGIFRGEKTVTFFLHCRLVLASDHGEIKNKELQ